MAPSPWTLRDLTEFDLLLHRDLRIPPGMAEEPVNPKASRGDVLHTWLRRTRELYPDVSRLAESTVRSEAFLRLSLCGFALLTGMGLASALLHYEGTRLINIGVFLGVTVGGQLLLLLLMGIGQVLFRKPVSGLDRWLLPESVRRLSAPHALPAWSWRLFTTLQMSALFANLGILLGLFWNVLTRDLAFGWATTLNTSSEAIHRIVTVLASPWGGGWTPTMDEIIMSRIRTSQGIGHLPPEATSSWWPFLLMCILFYGILPRLILAFAGQWRLNRLLQHPRFDAPSSRRLHQRLVRPPLQVPESEVTDADASPAAELPALTPSGPLRIDAEPEALAPDRVPDLQRILKDQFDLDFTSEPDADAGCLRIQEAWMPPLEEHLQQMRDLRNRIGAQADLLVLLTGEPDSGDGLPLAPDRDDVQIWSRRLKELDDPNLGVLIWPGESS